MNNFVLEDNANCISFLRKLKRKIFLLFISFPIHVIRIIALKSCGFKIGKKVYVAEGLRIALTLGDIRCQLIVGDRVALAPRVTIVLSSGANWSKINNIIKPKRDKVVIEDDCWIGANVTILPGITIGKHSVIGAGAVVTKDIPPYSVAMGIPAKVSQILNEKTSINKI